MPRPRREIAQHQQAVRDLTADMEAVGTAYSAANSKMACPDDKRNTAVPITLPSNTCTGTATNKSQACTVHTRPEQPHDATPPPGRDAHTAAALSGGRATDKEMREAGSPSRSPPSKAPRLTEPAEGDSRVQADAGCGPAAAARADCVTTKAAAAHARQQAALIETALGDLRSAKQLPAAEACQQKQGAATAALQELHKAAQHTHPAKPVHMRGGGPENAAPQPRTMDADIEQLLSPDTAACTVAQPWGCTDWLSSDQISQGIRAAVNVMNTNQYSKYTYPIPVRDLIQMVSNMRELAESGHLTARPSQLITAALLTHSHPIAIPLGDNLHWRALLATPHTKTIYLYDPMGAGSWNSSNDCRALERALQRLSQAMPRGNQWNLHKITHVMQWDTHNCGVWIIWAAATWTQYHADPPRAQDFESHMVQQLHSQAGRRARHSYKTFINLKRAEYRRAMVELHTSQPPGTAQADATAQPNGQKPNPPPGRTSSRNKHTAAKPSRNAAGPHKVGPACKKRTTRVTSSQPRASAKHMGAQRKDSQRSQTAARNLRTATLKEILARHEARRALNLHGHKAAEPPPVPHRVEARDNKRPQVDEPEKQRRYVGDIDDAGMPSASPLDTTGHIKTLTWNPRSLNRDSIAELQAMVETADPPDFVFVAETKCNSSRRKKLPPRFPAYQLHSSAARASAATEEGRQAWSAGVLVLVHNRYCKKGHKVTNVCPPAHLVSLLQGHIVHVTVQLPHQPRLHVLGVYMPCTGAEANSIRRAAYEYLREVTTTAQTAGECTLMGGDWNAVLTEADRSSGAMSSQDKAHADFVHTSGLRPLGGMHPRQHTYMADSDSKTTSRLDDVLVMAGIRQRTTTGRSDNKRQCTAEQAAIPKANEQRLQDTPSSDHAPLAHTLPPQMLRIQRPTLCMNQPTQIARTVLALPISKAALLELKATLEERLAVTAEHLRRDSHTLREQAESRHASGEPTENLRAEVDTLWQRLAETLQQCNTIALNTLPTKTVGGKKRAGGHLTKQERKQYERAHDTCVAAKYALRCASERPSHLEVPRLPTGAMQHQRQGERATALQDLWNTFNNCHDGERSQQQWVAHLEAARTTAQRDMRELQRARGRAAARKHAANLQHKLDTAPGRAHKDIFRPKAEQGAPALRIPGRPEEITTDPVEITEIWHQHISSMMGDQHRGPATETAAATAQPPWQVAHPDAPDTYTLLTRANQTRPEDRDNLVTHIANGDIFRECVAELSHGKAPGPDEVTNEVLKYLPDAMHTTMHNLYVAMYCTGHAPPSMLESNTIMLHKKGDPLQPGNYRPIGLANTALKLYTRLLTHVLQGYALQQNIVTGSQEGFLPYRNTIRQVNTMVSIIEDAALTHQDLYVMYIDFSNAFNTVDHTRMQEIMLMLGFSHTATQAVMSLYRGATTRVVSAAGTTTPIHICRGTIQGDTLSPFLFLLYIEPLLRWLQAGGRGYRLGSLSPKRSGATGDGGDARAGRRGPDRSAAARHEAERLRCAAAAYADDLAAATGSLTDMQVQAAKIARYAAWARLKVNVAKCAVTGILHGEQHGLPPGARCGKRMLQSLQSRLTGSVRIGGHPVPFLPPDEPYTYLGFELTMTLNWRHLYDRVVRQTQQAGAALARCSARPQQKLRVLRTCICPAIHYHMPLAPYGPGDIARLDALVTQIAKQCCQLPRGMATALVREDLHSGGAGVTSLQESYVQLAARDLVQCRNDQGRLGIMKRALLTVQQRRAGGLQAKDVGTLARYSVQLRQLQLATVPDATRIVDKGMPLQMDTACGLAATLRNVKVDPTDLGAWRRVDTAILTPLFELGIYNLADLVEKTGPAQEGGRGVDTVRLIDSAMLTDLYGTRAPVRDAHRIALNRLTKLLHSDNEGSDYSKYGAPGPLPATERTVRHATLFTELHQGGQCWPTIPALWQRAASRAATSLTAARMKSCA